MLKIICIFGFILSATLWVNNMVNDVVGALQATVNPFGEEKTNEDDGKAFAIVRVVLACLMSLFLTGIICL